MTPDFAVILPAAGSGSRFGGGDKLLAELAPGQSVLRLAVALFAQRPDVASILIVTAGDRIEEYRAHLAADPSLNNRLAFTEGGRERWESVMNGLHYLAAGNPPPFVGIHDTARPLCPQAVIDAAFASTRTHNAGLPCLAEPATLKRMGPDGTVAETVDRRTLYQAQTPQCFALKPLLEGYQALQKANRVADLTDDAQVFERTGRPVPITAGDPLNLKITKANDLQLARALFQLDRSQ